MFSAGTGPYVSYSSNLGVTWTVPILVKISSYAKNPSVGHGIQLIKICVGDEYHGRLILPWVCGEHSLMPDDTNVYHSCLVYSDDHGITWTLGAIGQNGSRESEIVQITLCSPCSMQSYIYTTERNFQGENPGHRFYALSENAAENFTTEGQDMSLIEPVTPTYTGIVASVVRFSYSDKANTTINRILFSDPENLTQRVNITMRASYDETNTWTSGYTIYAGPSGYSELTKINATYAGIFYENGVVQYFEKISFQLFDVNDL